MGKSGTSGEEDNWIELGCALEGQVTGFPTGFVMRRKRSVLLAFSLDFLVGKQSVLLKWSRWREE